MQIWIQRYRKLEELQRQAKQSGKDKGKLPYLVKKKKQKETTKEVGHGLQNRLRAVTKMMIISHCNIRGTGPGTHKKLKWLGKKIRIGPRRNMLPPERVKQRIRLWRGYGNLQC